MANKVDVLICGSGSAGLAAAVWLSRYGISFKMLERRSGPLDRGQADGVQTRTVEIFDSFGIGEELLRESYHVMEIAFWKWSDEKEQIKRSHYAPDKEDWISHRPHVILNQARLNGLLLSQLPQPEVVQYDTKVNNVEMDSEAIEKGDEYCVRAQAVHKGEEQTWQARYVLACDGAHSTVRKSLDYKMVGDSSDSVWGVMDVYPQTDFPDIRKKSVLLSPKGDLLLIPREGDYMVRFYMELPEGTDASKVTLEDLQKIARRVFHPYKMDIVETSWWSAYVIGQRVADHFHKDHRIFLTGDACHTHSPKAGQGMNVSLQDGYNIGWKLGQVLTGQASPKLLETYVSERQQTAKDLIDFDTMLTQLFSAKYRQENNISPEYFAEQFTKSGTYTAGQGVHYKESLAISPTPGKNPSLPQKMTLGMRLPSAQVVRYSDATAVQLLTEMRANCCWRIVVFAGDLSDAGARERLDLLATKLETINRSFPQTEQSPGPAFQHMLVLKTTRTEIEAGWIPEVFTPLEKRWNIKSLHSVYVDDESYDSGHGKAFETYGFETSQPEAIVVVRPDQYVAKICGFEDVEAVGDFFRGFMYHKTPNGTT